MPAAAAAATTSSSLVATTLHSIATVVGIAALHAFAVGVVRRTKSGDTERDTNTNTTANAGETVSSANDSHGDLIADIPTCIVITLPEWTVGFYNQRKHKAYTSEREMMQVAMELSKLNVQQNTGGPFGTAIFEHDPATGESKLFSIGVNRVVPLSNSTLHGEMTAIQFGQQKIGSFSFASGGKNNSSATGNKEYHLYTSCAPCCQCLGATMWSGVSKLVCGATKADAEAIGFSEGPVFDPESYDALEAAGCTVVREVLRDECKDVLEWYGTHGEIYNP